MTDAIDKAIATAAETETRISAEIPLPRGRVAAVDVPADFGPPDFEVMVRALLGARVQAAQLAEQRRGLVTAGRPALVSVDGKAL